MNNDQSATATPESSVAPNQSAAAIFARAAELRRSIALARSEFEFEISPLTERLAADEAALKDLAMTAAATIHTESGRVEFRMGARRVKWDERKLEAYGATHPEILEFRTLTVGDPVAAIVYAKGREGE